MKLMLSDEIKSVLLKCRTRNTNITWCTDNYEAFGDGYSFSDEVTLDRLQFDGKEVIIPRREKNKEEQKQRTKDKAEVFTPSWTCNMMNTLADEGWLAENSRFNDADEKNKTWKTRSEKIEFKEGSTWKDYVSKNVLEITCGEAPYLVSRYDTVSGEYIEVKDRIGLLDRKLRVVSENVNNDAEWHFAVLKAYEATYGYEWQGDNLFIARQNLLLTFIDNYKERFGVDPTDDELLPVAEVISWNIFQMDGLKMVVPNSCKNGVQEGDSVIITDCEGCKYEKKNKSGGVGVIPHNGIPALIYNWNKGETLEFRSMIKKGK